MKKYSREIKIGLTVVVTIFIFIWGYNYLKGNDIFSKQEEYYVVYERVEGLNESNPVLVNGYKVGFVQEMYFHPERTGEVVVKIVMTETDFSFPENTVAWIVSADLLGSKAIELVLGDAKEYAQPGDTLQDAIKASLTDEVNRTVEPLKVRALSLFSQIDSVLVVVQKIFNEDTRENLTESIESIRNTLDNVEKTSGSLDTLVTDQKSRLSNIFTNLESISSNLKDNNEEITIMIQNLSSISDTLLRADIKNTVANANRALTETADIMEKINTGEGSLGMLVNNDSLYNSLNQASKDLDELFKDMKDNPDRYVHFSLFGRKNKQPQN